jgi:aminoglycoside 6'-N-acetyltransferase I
VKIRSVDVRDKAEWLRMRLSYWPELGPAKHEIAFDRLFWGTATPATTLVAERENGRLGGFLQAGTRSYAEGCSSSPVGYIENWWVDQDLRRSGVGALLISAAEAWACSLGLTEMASDTELANNASRAAHQALGYSETERLIFFRKTL